ncbi:MAG: hypothetical protein HRU20_08405 [Pseudomonadales bacterium]|nr:hypothetical protein [Pseudomonadales bacterium]
MKLWNVNFLHDWPIVSITANKKMQEKKRSKTQKNQLKPGFNSAYAPIPIGLKGDKVMTVNGLIKVFIKPHDDSFHLSGPYGYINMVPEHHRNGPDTYHVDCCYKTMGNQLQEQHADGFRLSTACCLTACVMFGEQEVNDSMIATINTKLN